MRTLGTGIPVIFVHEFAGDCRSYEMQVRHFSKNYRCVTFNARGYPPSDVPKDVARYSQERARDDIRAVLDALDIDRAHIVGLSMGAFATLHFGFGISAACRSLVVAGCGYGARARMPERSSPLRLKPRPKQFEEQGDGQGCRNLRARPDAGPIPEQESASAGRNSRRSLAEHSAQGSALTMRGSRNAGRLCMTLSTK